MDRHVIPQIYWKQIGEGEYVFRKVNSFLVIRQSTFPLHGVGVSSIAISEHKAPYRHKISRSDQRQRLNILCDYNVVNLWIYFDCYQGLFPLFIAARGLKLATSPQRIMVYLGICAAFSLVTGDWTGNPECCYKLFIIMLFIILSFLFC